MSEAGNAVSVSDGSGFSVESLINEANKAWDEPDDTSSGTDTNVGESPGVAGAESSTPEQPVQEVVADRGDGRDQKGRFAPKGEKPDEVQDGAAKAPEAVPSPTQDQAKAAPETPPGTSEPPKAEGSAEPFSVRYGGKDYEIPGAVRTDTHVVIPRAQEETISRYVGMGLKYETERETVKQEKARLAVERDMFAAETGPVMEEVKRLFEIAALSDEEEFAKQFSAYAWQLRTELPLLRERMELSKRRQELEIRERMSAPDPEQAAQQLATSAFETAQGHLAQWKSDPQTKAMTEEDWRWVTGRVEKDPAHFLAKAGQRLTSEEQENGVQPGEVYFRQDRLVDLVNIRLEHRTALAQAVEAQKKAVALAKENATRQASGSVPPPPASGGADSAPAATESGAPQSYKSMDELKKALGVAW